MKKFRIIIIALLILSVLFFYLPTINAANISPGNTYASTDGTSGRLVINSISSSIIGSSWSVTITYNINMVNSWLYTGGGEYFRYFTPEINGVTGPAAKIKENTDYWYSGNSFYFLYNLRIPVNPDNNIVSARFVVSDGYGSLGDVATFDTGAGNTITLQAVQKATDLSLNISNATLYNGQSAVINPIVSPSNTYNKGVHYSSSNSAVASVSSSGVITAFSAGSANVTATTADGSNISRSVAVTVKQYVSSISVNNTSATLYVGGSLKVTATALPNDASDKRLEYSSSNPAVAVIFSDGTLNAIKAGTSTITITAADQSAVSTIIQITVLQKATSLSIDNLIDAIYIDHPYELRANILPEDTSDKILSYSTSDPLVASIDASGLITPIAKGKATITVATKDGSNLIKSFEVEIMQYVKSITSTKPDITLYTGETQTLQITALPAEANNKELSFASSDDAIATVNQSGKITAIKAGSTLITISSTDGSNVALTIPITIKQYAKQITVDETKVELPIENTYQIIANILPEDTTDKNVSYSSTDESILSVDDSGLVTAHALGKAKVIITATDRGSVSKEVSFTVKRLISDILISTDTPTELYTGNEITLECSVLPRDATEQALSFTSSDESIASIDQSGVIHAIKEGSVIITVKSMDGTNIEKNIVVNIRQSIETIAFDSDELILSEGEKLPLHPIILPSNAYNTDLVYQTSNPFVVRVDENGVLLALSKGEAAITARSSDGSSATAKFEVIVTRPVIQINYLNKDIKAYVGESKTLFYEIYPYDATNTSVTFSSSDTKVVSVDESGKIIALKEGNAVISITSKDNPLLTDNCSVSAIIKPMVKSEVPVSNDPKIDKPNILQINSTDLDTQTPKSNPLSINASLKETDEIDYSDPDTFISRETVRNIIICLGIISLILLIVFRRPLLFPVIVDDQDEDEKDNKEKK